jgi:mono/diheme cytochrome c family protein
MGSGERSSLRSPFFATIRRSFNMRGTSLIAGAVGIMLFAAGPCIADNLELPPGPNRALVYGQCRTCHDLQYLKESAGITRDDWDQILISMRQYGLRIPQDQRDKILEYLGTYLGPNPPPATAANAPAATAEKIDGAAVYNEQCVACHQQNGEGVAEQFPPLKDNRDIFLSREFPARVVLFGLKGKIDVNGHAFDAEMPPLDVLSDQQIAAVIAYVRGAWGNGKLRPKDMAPIDAAAVTKLRQQKNVTAEQVYAQRKQLKGSAASK